MYSEKIIGIRYFGISISAVNSVLLERDLLLIYISLGKLCFCCFCMPFLTQVRCVQRSSFFIFIIGLWWFSVWEHMIQDKTFFHVGVLFLSVLFCLDYPEVFSVCWSFTQRKQGMPFSSASWTRRIHNTISYLLCVALDALVKRRAFKNEDAVDSCQRLAAKGQGLKGWTWPFL